jgi:hypothetical protein
MYRRQKDLRDYEGKNVGNIKMLKNRRRTYIEMTHGQSRRYCFPVVFFRKSIYILLLKGFIPHNNFQPIEGIEFIYNEDLSPPVGSHSHPFQNNSGTDKSKLCSTLLSSL